jgi:hypothetical protein
VAGEVPDRAARVDGRVSSGLPPLNTTGTAGGSTLALMRHAGRPLALSFATEGAEITHASRKKAARKGAAMAAAVGRPKQSSTGKPYFGDTSSVLRGQLQR